MSAPLTLDTLLGEGGERRRWTYWRSNAGTRYGWTVDPDGSGRYAAFGVVLRGARKDEVVALAEDLATEADAEAQAKAWRDAAQAEWKAKAEKRTKRAEKRAAKRVLPEGGTWFQAYDSLDEARLNHPTLTFPKALVEAYERLAAADDIDRINLTVQLGGQGSPNEERFDSLTIVVLSNRGPFAALSRLSWMQDLDATRLTWRAWSVTTDFQFARHTDAYDLAGRLWSDKALAAGHDRDFADTLRRIAGTEAIDYTVEWNGPSGALFSHTAEVPRVLDWCERSLRKRLAR